MISDDPVISNKVLAEQKDVHAKFESGIREHVVS